MFSSEVSLLSQVRRKHSASFFGNVFQMSGERTFCAAVLKQIGYSSAVRFGNELRTEYRPRDPDFQPSRRLSGAVPGNTSHHSFRTLRTHCAWNGAHRRHFRRHRGY